MTNGNIINITRFCTHDGPGIRTTVFLKGCPLRCIWCHNPESHKKEIQLSYDKTKCINCGGCVTVCEMECHSFVDDKHIFSRENCNLCKKCTEVCPTNALMIEGHIKSVEEIIKEVEKDKTFYNTSGGGITISGGEPLFQPDFTYEILKECKKRNIHTAIETSGFASGEVYEKVIRQCELVLFDIKETNPENHLKYTGVSLTPILENLHLTDKLNIPFIIRLPIIPGINDRKEHFLNVKKLISGFKNCKDINIMPYHKLGAYKYDLLGLDYKCSNIEEPDKETVQKWGNIIS